jgi:predicted metalloprotease with PDZ domain
MRDALLLSVFAFVVADETARGDTLPQSASPTPAVEAPRDIPFEGAIGLSVDATDLPHGVFNVRETIPLAGPGPVTLLYPKWLPGNHSPTGPIDKLAGLKITANGAPVAWRRDPVDVYAFHVDAPAGAASLDVSFQFLSAVSTREGRVMMTPDMLSLEWNTVALYPAGYFSRRIMVAPSVTLPVGFSLAGALETASTAGSTTTFKPTPFNTLVDSPLIAGRYFRRFDLDPGAATRVSLDVVADRPELLDATQAELAAHRTLVQQAYKLYGSHHYEHYDFLLSVSDKLGGVGLEHHQSSEDGVVPKYFTDWDKTAPQRDLLPHEYTHSWNGKFRRPADLWTPDFNTPMRDSLLWVYEGQTQYWGFVLAARAGLLTRQEALDAIANVAATYDHRLGREWRDLEDTTNDPIIAMRRPLSWRSWQRSEDYYSEGQLVWLDAVTLIFFGVDNGSFVTHTYTFEDVVEALNGVQPYDWASFLHTRLQGHGPGAPLDGLSRGGYRLAYSDTESPYLKSAETLRKITDLSYSIGVIIGKDGILSDVAWDGPAFKAGLTADTQIVAVNGNTYDADALKDAITAAHSMTAPLQLLVKDKDSYRTVNIDYHAGLRYPHLERTKGAMASLDTILQPRP